MSYEFVACQLGNEKGVLVLSEFAGAAQALGAGCVRVNPYNTEEVSRGMDEALSMPSEQRTELHTYALKYVEKYTAQARIAASHVHRHASLCLLTRSCLLGCAEVAHTLYLLPHTLYPTPTTLKVNHHW